jgi:hypothetical protein
MESPIHSGQKSFLSITYKTVLVHTVTYFLMGLIAFSLFNYSAKYADPVLGNFMRQTSHPLVAAGPLFQIIRGILFGVVFYLLKEVVFDQKHGWLVLWLMLFIVGVLSPFGPSPGSIEGMVYTTIPLDFHLTGLPEVTFQSLLLAWFTFFWVNHPEKKWFNWVFMVLFVLAILMSVMGVLAALGIIIQP